jgi:hypothetical protein
LGHVRDLLMQLSPDKAAAAATQWLQKAAGEGGGPAAVIRSRAPSAPVAVLEVSGAASGGYSSSGGSKEGIVNVNKPSSSSPPRLSALVEDGEEVQFIPEAVREGGKSGGDKVNIQSRDDLQHQHRLSIILPGPQVKQVWIYEV